ncbi:hypothetical protein C6P40_001051 [Pichia californica]|uniref:Calcineurin-like phosphoesterase domain-containing protein n=1 Tax=Pichia californica TaxID=460514 RepID=A0A9P7BEY4_9ASCO|nr:hypothetical protein C6P40_001051 [[Candida] californica]
MNTDEYSPLSGDDVYYVEIQEEGILPDFMQKNKTVRYGIYSIASLSIVLLLYVMIIYLPSLAPEGKQIPDIPMVKNSKVYLHPVIPEKIKGKNPDPDDPVKVIPKFSKLEYASDETPVLKKHLKKLSNITNISKQFMKKRLILIGDVHGSLKQLKKFLQYVEYDGGKEDQVILLGDFTNKGKDSIGVLDFAIEQNLQCILGNHELAMMKRYTQFHGLKTPIFLNDDEYSNSTLTIKEEYDLDELMKLAKKITPKHIDFLSTCSPIRKIGPVPHFINGKQNKHALYPANGVAVHAGLVWSKGINHQNVEEVTTIRNYLPPDWKIPTEDRKDKVGGVKSVAWSKIWNEHQLEIYKKELAKANDDTVTIGTKVYYGHDAKRGVVTKEFSNGLDSGCVYGQQLTGVIIWSQMSSTEDHEDSIVYKQMHVSINC